MLFFPNFIALDAMPIAINISRYNNIDLTLIIVLDITIDPFFVYS